MELTVVLNSPQFSYLSFLSGEITGVSYHAHFYYATSMATVRTQLLIYAGLAMDENPLECFRLS